MGAYTKLLSIIVPCYNEEESVPLFYQEAIKQETFFHEKDVELELIFVDDGSKDRTVEEVKKLREKDERIHLVSFSRNFGKEAAIIAGLEKAKGDFTVLMDADLQDPPALLPEMYGYIEQGYDSVATRRVDRKGEPPIRSFFARRFYGLMRKISKTEIVDGARVFVFSGWYYGFFHNAVIHCILFWNFILYSGICLYDLYLCQSFDLWRSGSRLAFHGMYYFLYRRRSAAVSGYYGAVYE